MASSTTSPLPLSTQNLCRRSPRSNPTVNSLRLFCSFIRRRAYPSAYTQALFAFSSNLVRPLVTSIAGSCHRERNGNMHFPLSCPWLESPTAVRGYCSVVENGITGALRHGRVDNCTCSHVDGEYHNAASSDVPRSRLVGILGSRGKHRILRKLQYFAGGVKMAFVIQN